MATQFQCTSIIVAEPTPPPAPIFDITNLVATDLSGGLVRLDWDQNLAGDIDIRDNGVHYVRTYIGTPGSQFVLLENITAGEHVFCVQKAA